MAVDPVLHSHGSYTLYVWTLTSADAIAVPTPVLAMRSDKSVDIHGVSDAAGFNTATVEIHGTLTLTGSDHFKLQNSVPDTQDLSFTAATDKAYLVLPNVARIKPVVTAGAPGATGIIVELLVTSARGFTG